MSNKILITGGAGYIGSILVARLLQEGYEVTVFDNFMYNQQSLLSDCNNDRLKIINNDVRELKIFEEQVKEHKTIIPLAGIVGAPACDKDKDLATAINQTQLENIANWTSTNQKIICPITNSGYGIGQKNNYCDENTPLNPISHYGRTKVAGEAALMEKGNAISFRLATVFGVAPRMRIDLLVNDFVHKAYHDRYIVLFESHFKRNFIHIRDVTNAFIFAINNYEQMKGEVFNIGLSNANLSKLELCEKIKKHLPDLHVFESEIGKDPDKRDYIVSNAKIESLGWSPLFTIDNGILELIKAYSFLKTNIHNNL